MPTDCLRNTRKKKTCFAQVSEVEKQLWARIHSHGVLDTTVKGLYHKACCIYEKLFLSDNELQELQNIEYLLWRLHYKHIDEFRKTICQSEAKIEDGLASNNGKGDNTMSNVNVHKKGFRLFLSEATKLYQDLIRSIKRYNGLFDEPWFYKDDGVSGRIEQMQLHKCQFVCHRLCICLGDLARYLEQYDNVSDDQRNWSVAATYYLEAIKIYPDGGNPQNQLAVLAMYIGDEFLALYHCIRSLAVKEPFPDALQNLMLLFERNRSSDIVSLKNEVYNFLEPSDWISDYCEEHTNGSPTSRSKKIGEFDPCAATDFWTLFIRMSSFFFVDSSLESFACTFTSTLREFEALLALDVSELSSTLQSYQNMNLLKAGPYRALHIVSVLLYIIYNQNLDLERKIPIPTNKGEKREKLILALTVTFIFMGRLVDRCLKGSPVVYFPLLPALLVFVEWLVGGIKLDALDDKCEKAMCYFFGSFVQLLKHLHKNTSQIDSSCNVALWEDYELRGFIPLSLTHELMDFSTRWEDEINYKMKNDYRAHRIVQAAIKIAGTRRDNSISYWLVYDKAAQMFRIDNLELNTVEEEEEEEENIVFNPIARHNSVPLTFTDRQIPEASNDSLRRASSLLVAQNRALIDSLTSPFSTPGSNLSNQLAQDECIPNGSSPTTGYDNIIAAGPPSLSSWVLSGDITKNNCIERTVLKSIAEITPEPFTQFISSSVERTHEATNVVGSSSSSDPRESGRSQFPEFPTQDFRWGGYLTPQDQYYEPANHNSVYGSGTSGFGLLDHWSHNDPLGSLPKMCSEGSPPLFQPSPSLLQGLHEQRRDVRVSDTRLEPRKLLEYLKQRELQLQKESQFTGSCMQK